MIQKSFSLLELRHLDSVDSALVTLVAQLATAAVLGLLQVVGGEETIDNRNLLCCIEACDAIGNTLADVIEVRSLTTNHATQDDDSVVSAIENHLMSAVNQLEASGNSLYVDVLRQSSVLLQCLNGSVKQSSGYLRIPFCHNNAEAHVACVRNATEVVFR